MKKIILLCFLLFMALQQTFAWGMTGHRVIAEIAERHLTKKAKKHIQKIIGHQKLAYWSNWADFIKSDPDPKLKETWSWHYVNFEANLTPGQFKEALAVSPKENLYQAYLTLKEGIKDQGETKSQLEKQQDLYFVLHLYADAHQPMHVGRPEDLGGNKIEVSFFGRKANIHRVWDSDLVDNEQYSFMEYADVLDIHDKAHYKGYKASFADVLYESHQLANKIYADVAINRQLSYTYIYDYKFIMEESLLKAGIRLAMELNELYG